MRQAWASGHGGDAHNQVLSVKLHPEVHSAASASYLHQQLVNTVDSITNVIEGSSLFLTAHDLNFNPVLGCKDKNYKGRMHFYPFFKGGKLLIIVAADTEFPDPSATTKPWKSYSYMSKTWNMIYFCLDFESTESLK